MIRHLVFANDLRKFASALRQGRIFERETLQRMTTRHSNIDHAADWGNRSDG